MSENVIEARLCAQNVPLLEPAILKKGKEWINELNVFPVPDGDTGTNMTMTIMSAADEVSALEEPTMDAVVKAMSSGSLRGARGNSGVILSASQDLQSDPRQVGTGYRKPSFLPARKQPKLHIQGSHETERTILTVAKGCLYDLRKHLRRSGYFAGGSA